MTLYFLKYLIQHIYFFITQTNHFRISLYPWFTLLWQLIQTLLGHANLSLLQSAATVIYDANTFPVQVNVRFPSPDWILTDTLDKHKSDYKHE